MLAYGISWGAFGGRLLDLPRALQLTAEYVTKFGPALAGLLVVVGLGSAARREWLARIVRWRMHPGWYLFALAGPAILWLGAIAVHASQGAGWPASNWNSDVVISALGLFALRLFAGGGFGEEPGWRGFALPQLEQRMSALSASLLIGVVWGVWHFAAFFVPGSGKEGGIGEMVVFTIYTCALSIIFTWFFHKTNGSVLLAALLHASLNSTENVFKLLMPGLSDSNATLFFGLCVLAFAVGLALACGRNLEAFRVPGRRLNAPAQHTADSTPV
jgi:membrane protease YdiL (CAAX protease family)